MNKKVALYAMMMWVFTIRAMDTTKEEIREVNLLNPVSLEVKDQATEFNLVKIDISSRKRSKNSPNKFYNIYLDSTQVYVFNNFSNSSLPEIKRQMRVYAFYTIYWKKFKELVGEEMADSVMRYTKGTLTQCPTCTISHITAIHKRKNHFIGHVQFCKKRKK